MTHFACFQNDGDVQQLTILANFVLHDQINKSNLQNCINMTEMINTSTVTNITIDTLKLPPRRIKIIFHQIILSNTCDLDLNDKLYYKKREIKPYCIIIHNYYYRIQITRL